MLNLNAKLNIVTLSLHVKSADESLNYAKNITSGNVQS